MDEVGPVARGGGCLLLAVSGQRWLTDSLDTEAALFTGWGRKLEVIWGDSLGGGCLMQGVPEQGLSAPGYR